MRLYEVVDLSPGASVDLRDVLTGARVQVHERLGSRSLTRHVHVAARVVDRGPSGRPEIEAGFFQIPELIWPSVVSQLADYRADHRRERPEAEEVEFLEEMAPFFHQAWMTCLFEPPVPDLKNSDGDDLLLTRMRFDVIDRAGLEGALDGSGDFERDDDGRAVWHWSSGPNRRGEEIALGLIRIDGDTLSVECNSAQRAERARAMLEALARNAVRHRSTMHENLAVTLREQIRAGGPGRPRPGGPPATDGDEEIPRELQEAMVLDHLGRHYRGWIDEPVPALQDRTPRDAARDRALQPKVIELIEGLEGMYERALKEGEPAYDPSWMWSELGLECRGDASHPPPLLHERMALAVPGIGPLCRRAAERFRRRPGFDDATSTVTADEIGADLEIQRFLREARLETERSAVRMGAEASTSLLPYVLEMTGFELHRRKAFWVDEALAYMLSRTKPDVNGRDLRVPFPSFAIVFTDRCTLSLAESLLSADRGCPLAGQILRVASVHVTEEHLEPHRGLRIAFGLDALGADPPHLVIHRVPLPDDAPVERSLDRLAPPVEVEPPVADANPLRGLLQLTLNAILYATSAGVEPLLLQSPVQARRRRRTAPPAIFTSENVFFLPGAIEISAVRRIQELERIPSGRTIACRFMVRGHWRRPPASWKDQRIRWIKPHWKGPDIAAVIERAYKLKPPSAGPGA